MQMIRHKAIRISEERISSASLLKKNKQHSNQFTVVKDSLPILNAKRQKIGPSATIRFRLQPITFPPKFRHFIPLHRRLYVAILPLSFSVAIPPLSFSPLAIFLSPFSPAFKSRNNHPNASLHFSRLFHPRQP